MGNIIRLGNAAGGAGEAGVVFGEGSALLMRGHSDAPLLLRRRRFTFLPAE